MTKDQLLAVLAGHPGDTEVKIDGKEIKESKFEKPDEKKPGTLTLLGTAVPPAPTVPASKKVGE